MPRIVFLGSSESVFSNLHFRALEDTGCGIAAVIDVPASRRVSTNTSRTDGTSFVERAAGRGIPVLVPRDPNEPSVVEEIRRLAPDAFVAVGYLLILRERLLSVPRVVAANFHASLLPAYRGKHPVFWALRNGERWSGVTVHEMSPSVDAGDIIFQLKVRVGSSDSVSSLYDRIIARSLTLVPRLVACIAKGRLPRRPQPVRGASTGRATREEDFRLDLSRPARVLARWITATPGQCFADLGGKRVYFTDARAAGRRRGPPPGALLKLDADSCLLSTGQGALCVRMLKAPGGPVAPAAQILGASGLAEGGES